MPNHVLKDGVWTSDKLAACVWTAQMWPAHGGDLPIFPSFTLGDQARLAYGYCPILLQDDWGCFELNLPVIRIRCFSRFENIPTVEQMRAWFQLWNWNGLLFVWEELGKPWAYVTGDEEGRLHPPSRRHHRKTPTLGHDPKKSCAKWPQVTEYLAAYNQLQPTTDGLLSDYKIVQPRTAALQQPSTASRAASASLRPPTESAPQPYPDPQPDPQPDPDRSVPTGTALSNVTDPRDGTSQQPLSKVLKTLAGDVGTNGSLRKKLEQGIHRTRMFKTYDDFMIEQTRRGGDRTLTEFVARGVTEETAKLLIVARGFKELGKTMNSSQLTAAAWPRVERALPVLAHLLNYDTRKRQFGGYVINCVVNAALELREKPQR